MTIARVFPRKTKATPDDALAFTGPPPKGIDGIDEVCILPMIPRTITSPL